MTACGDGGTHENRCLQIVDVQVSDMAGYLCVAENKVGAVQKLYSLAVHGKTSFFSISVSISHEINISAELVLSLPLSPAEDCGCA